MNLTLFIGRLASDVRVNILPSSSKVASFRLAVDGQAKQTPFINVVAWDKTGEFVERNLAKGFKVSIESRVNVSQWSTPEGNRERVEFVANRVVVLSKPAAKPDAALEPESIEAADAQQELVPA